MMIRNMFEKDITKRFKGLSRFDQREEEVIYNDL
jgi:hypothetical protein